MQRVYFKDLPVLTEAADEDTLLARDASEDKVGVFSIATLRAAMGSPDRIKSASGDAFSEATDSFRGLGTPASQSEAIARGAGASSGAYTLPKGADKAVAEAALFAGTAAMTNGASIKARYDSETGERRLVAEGAPLEVPTPTAPNHAATKGYVDARPGAEKWSEHAATQDVDLDGHKLTGLGEPTDAADAATKGYVDGAAPAKIERTFAWGRSVAEVADNGDIELAVYRTGEADPLRRVRVYRGDASGAISLMNRSSMAVDAWVNTLQLTSTTSPGFHYELSGGPPAGSESRGRVMFSGGRFSVVDYNGVASFLSDSTYRVMPAGVGSYKHAAHLAKEAYDTLASMPAPPDLEWWDPVWTPMGNVDSVANVECSYTRTYRAAGGSLVTLEGTITVEIDDDSALTTLSAPLPVPATSTGPLLTPAIGMDLSRGHRSEVRVGVVNTGSGPVLAIDAGELSSATGVPATLTIGFRISYRAA